MTTTNFVTAWFWIEREKCCCCGSERGNFGNGTRLRLGLKDDTERGQSRQMGRSKPRNRFGAGMNLDNSLSAAKRSLMENSSELKVECVGLKITNQFQFQMFFEFFG